MTEIERFSQALLEDKDLANGLKDLGNNLEKIVQYANGKGFRIAMADLVAAVQENAALSEEDLDNVTGGSLTALGGVSLQIGDDGLTLSAKAKMLAVL